MSTTRSFVRVTWAVALLASIGCQQPRPAINRIQPDYIDKVDFIPNQYQILTAVPANPDGTAPTALITPTVLAKEPVFYTQTTLIAKPTTTGFTGLTSYSEADKIRWDVEEHFLIARQSYEYVKGAPTGAAGIGQNLQTGDPIGVFAITSHFDIIDDYNTTTGEALNVVVENTTDRPWYQRRYMHVDWSQNLVDGYQSVIGAVFLDIEGKIKADPVPVFVNSPSDPNAPVFVWSGDGDSRHLDYFDIVNKAILHPETAQVFDEGTNYTFPVCWLSEDSQDCSPVEATMRMAFRRADRLRDYEPAPVNVPIPTSDGSLTSNNVFEHLDMERFGFFEQSRIGYDPVQHATLDNERMHFASRHNIWAHHHMLVFGQSDGTGCNVDADCANGSLCNIGNTPVDAAHRGTCAQPGVAHDTSDIACSSDDDCLQTINSGGQSNSAFCDTSVGKCAEHYVRCAKDSDCTKLDPNSTCDLAIAYTRADNRGLCLMPFLQRQVKPIAYHESNNYPEYMQPVTETIVHEWNDAFTVAVTAARRHECELLNKVNPATTALATNPCNAPSVTGLDPNYGADAKYIFVGCHSPVWGTADGAGQHSAGDVAAANAKGMDLPVCGPQGTSARLGDLRYSMIGAITDHDQQGYWGLANIASDPETGEMVAGRGAVWQTITDTYAAYLVTLVKVLNGDLDPNAVSTGDYIVSSMKQLGTGQTPSAEVLDAPLRNSGGLDHIGELNTGLKNLAVAGNGWLRPNTPLLSNNVNVPGALTVAQERLLNGRVLGDGTAKGTSRLLSLAGTPLESQLINSDQAMLAVTASPDPTGALPQTVNQASPVRLQSAAVRRVINRLRSQLSAYDCEYDSMFSDDILMGLAERLAGGKPIRMNDPLDAPVAFGRDWNFGTGQATNYDLMAQYAAQFIHHGVLAHELGHSLGQRHNFTASADAINYNDQYWLVRGKGHATKAGDSLPGLRPRYDYLADPQDGQYYSQDEIDGRVDEWSYSSVMDYKGLNEDAHGIGRYDYAFIKNGYVGLVEAFKTVADMSGAVTYGANNGGYGFSTPLDLRDWAAQNGNGQVHGMHYTQIPTIFGTKMGSDGQTMVPNIGDDNRFNVFLRETCQISGWPADAAPCASIPGLGAPIFSNTTSDGSYFLVPYRFDTDERAGLVWQDQRYDNGADGFESLHYVASHYLDYYFANSFARLRSGFSTGGYVNRMWSRYLDQLHQTTQMMFFDLAFYQDFLGADSPGFNAYKNDPKQYAGFVNQQAMSLSADTLAALLTMPETGYQGYVPQFDKTTIVGPIQSGQYITNVPVNEGRMVESNWRTDVGFFWYDELNSAGSYYDKVMAIQAYTDPDLLLLQRDTPTDIRQFELNYYTMFPDQMIRLFGGVISEDYADFAPIVDIQNSSSTDIALIRPHVATLNLPPGNRAGQSGRVINRNFIPIDPQDHFTTQLWSIVHTMAQFPATYDSRYTDYMRTWVDGSIEAVDVQDPDTNTVSFVDPFSHLTWRAMHFGTNPGEQGASVGASPILHLSRASGTFAPKVDLPSAANPLAVATGDLNGDGRQDIVVANSFANSISVLLGQGGGHFAPKMDYPVGSGPVSVALGDINGDNKLDVVAANSGDGTVSVLLNQGGTFAAAVGYAAGANPAAVALGDTTGGGNLDIVVANKGGNSVSVLINKGAGFFGSKSDTAVGTGPVALALADLNGDKKLDVVAANSVSNNVTVLLNKGNGGWTSASYAVGNGPVSVAVGDLNGDMQPDVAVADMAANTISVLLNAGMGTLGAKNDLATGVGPSSVAIADLNGDKKLDLAATNTGDKTVSVLLNGVGGHVTGNFQGKIDYVTGAAPSALATADLSGDGQPDFVVANTQGNTVSVLVNWGGGLNGGLANEAGIGARAILHLADLDMARQTAIANNDARTVSLLTEQEQQYVDVLQAARAVTKAFGHGYANEP